MTNANATTATMASTASTSSTIPRQHYHRHHQQQQPLPDHSHSGRSYRELRDRADKDRGGDKGDHSTSSGGLLSWSKSDLSLLLMMDGTTDDLSETLSGHGDDPHTIITAKNCTAAKRKQEARRKMQQHYEDDDDNLSVYSSRTKAGGIADKQQRDNQKWKYCVELTLVLLGLSVTVATWIALSQAEEQHKQQQFAIAATQIRDGVETRAHRLRESLRVESQTITDLSLATEVEWPYYVPTSGSFQRQAEHVRDEANLQVLAVAPLVEVAQRDVWNRFVQFHYGRRTNSTTVPVYYYQDGKPTPYQPEPEMTTALEVSKEVDSELEKDDEEVPQTKTLLSGHNHTGPFHAPLWLMSPFPAESSAVINYDILSSRDAQILLQDMVMAQSAVISKVLDFSHLPRHAYPQDLDESQHTSYPHSLIFQPIYESYQTVMASAPEPETTDEALVYYNDSDATSMTMTTSFTTTTSNTPATTTSNTAPVAILFGIMYWHSYLQDLLPPNSQPGIMAEFLNTCGQSIKYRLDGDDATFVGQDTASLSTYKDFEETGHPYYAIPFAQQPLPHGCQYTLFVYPTDDFYLGGGGTSSAVLYTVLFAILFVAAAATVLFAIRRMQKGQHEAWSYAFEANNIIATLFPNSSFGFGGGGGHHDDDDDDDDDPRRTSILTWMLNRHQQKAAQDDLDMEEFGGLKGMNISNHSRRAPKGDRRRVKKSLQQQDQLEQFHESVGSLGIGSDDGKSTSGLVSVSGKGSISGLVSVSGKGSISSSKARRAYAKLKLRQQREKEEAKGKDQSWDDTPLGSRPIADLFPEATVLFADIVGFTAWSSSREPHHVFELLESIYHTFDDIARRRAVFKVDTVGDCYCCVTGVPIPRDDHAVIMAEFAREILVAFDVVTSTLEVQLGPETGDLCMRAGIHSGPVTAGVLRGDRSRFQIFGGTVSRTAKLEAEGEPGRIVISKETADLLAGAGKSTWFVQREKKVEAGGAALYTYWLDPRKDECEAIDLSRTGAHPALLRAANLIQRMDENCLIKTVHQRQVDWIVDQMEKLLKQVIIQRRQLEAAQEKQERNPDDGPTIIPQAGIAQSEVCVFDEVREVIAMPKYDALTALEIKETENIELSDDVLWQLHDFVTSISTMYRNNPFHNFEHASHVTMSVVKLLTRVVSPTDYTAQAQNVSSNDAGGSAAFRQSISKNKLELHDFSYGISSDPLTQFAVVFGALIHDVDHVGVSNAQLVKENDRLARIYKSQSVAEQNSVNIAWDLLMDPAFEALRRCIYTTPEEFDRFRATVINVVMATDIVDKDLKNLRNARWDKCFSKEDGEAWTKEDSDRKATIVLEHLIQASDISHTMQHWHVYQKWNHKLFRELYIAFIKGRMGANPAGFWYKGEIGFFDFYIIPLAKKLRDCGVFGVSCDEFLNYALENRAQWEKDGAAVVEKLINDVNNDKEIIALKEKYNFVEPEEEPKK